ncbi:hypothetical protein CVT24_008998 [Panaeolus cyanescens]|uniref:G domain-containing protein n=1 Tax=Panaeolus cyanescens TaxID=181874 RepID=A0A409YAQ9_9AGAR|nr:hypothetical protein CVT24_008998 [Panaeolus cyanescens]
MSAGKTVGSTNDMTITGTVSAERVDAVIRGSWKVLIMGPTGAGKSSFIEALGDKTSLQISSNRLDGCTQSISAYTLKNVRHRGVPIYVVDTPGFADTKISEVGIVSMLKYWMRLNGCMSVTVVTTMWDQVWGDSAVNRAESSFIQLRDDIWKGFIERGTQIVRFYNTQESALSILGGVFDSATPRGTDSDHAFELHTLNDNLPLSSTPFAHLLYDDLKTRIQSLHSQRENIWAEILHDLTDETESNEELREDIATRLAEVEKEIEKFEKELRDLGSPPQKLENFQKEGRMSRIFGSIKRVMGPTGAGKSSVSTKNGLYDTPANNELRKFIEALAGHDQSQISIASDQLDGFTQSVSAYRVTGVAHSKDSGPIFVIDTPGFADAKTSEMDIVLRIQKWMQEGHIPFFHRVLFLTPISGIRLLGSQRQVLSTFKALTGIVKTADQIILVTTMWDTLSGHRAKTRAEATFDEFRDVIWKECVERGSRVARFYNSRESALEILDGCLGDALSSDQYFPLEETRYGDKPLRDTPFAINLYDDLCARIQSLRLTQDHLAVELDHPSTHADESLMLFIKSELKDVNARLGIFEKQLDEFGPAPTCDHSPSEMAGSFGSSAKIWVWEDIANLYQCWGLLSEPYLRTNRVKVLNQI